MSAARHGKLLARTVLVKNGDVDKSYNMLQRILRTEGIVSEVRQRRLFERPCDQRSRLSYERCKRVYNSEMQRKVKFLTHKNRIDPHPR